MLRMAVALALLALLPPAQAAPFVLELSATLAVPVPIESLEARGGGDDPTGPCRTTYFSPYPAQRSFRFAERADANGCLSVVYRFTLPADVNRIGVDFRADRVREDAGRSVALGPAAFQQEVRLRVGDTLVVSLPYFEASQAERRQQQPFTLHFDVPPGPHEVELEWWFANAGDASPPNDPGAGRLQAWSATVSDPRVVLEGIPLEAPSLREERGQFQGGSYLTGFTGDLAVPSHLHGAAAAGTLSLHLRMPASALLDRILAPSGRDLPDDDYETSTDGTTRLVTLPAATLARLGPGPYVIRFQGTEAVHVEPSMALLTGAALLMPPVAIVLAARQLRRRSLAPYLEATDALEGELAPR